MALIPISVGHAREGYGTKYQFGIRQTSGDGQGWSHDFVFQAHETPVANTVPVRKITISPVTANNLALDVPGIHPQWVQVPGQVGCGCRW